MKVKDILPAPQYKLFVDLDGTLSDFSKLAHEVFKVDLDTADKQATSKFFKNLEQHMSTNNKFFEIMDPIPDAMHLWNYVKKYHPVILSSTGRIPGAEEEKRAWVRKHLGGAVASSALFVKKASEKALYAGPNHILIDDKVKAIDPWIAASGIGILHTTAASTIEKLTELGL